MLIAPSPWENTHTGNALTGGVSLGCVSPGGVSPGGGVLGGVASVSVSNGASHNAGTLGSRGKDEQHEI